MSGDYAVGYKKPPKKTRFKKGVSGNPNGRPKAVPNVKSALMSLMRRKVTVREGDESRLVDALEALLMGLFSKAIKGHAPSARTLLDLVTSMFPDLEPDDSLAPIADKDQTIVENFLRRHGLKPVAGSNKAKGRNNKRSER